MSLVKNLLRSPQIRENVNRSDEKHEIWLFMDVFFSWTKIIHTFRGGPKAVPRGGTVGRWQNFGTKWRIIWLDFDCFVVVYFHCAYGGPLFSHQRGFRGWRARRREEEIEKSSSCDEFGGKKIKLVTRPWPREQMKSLFVVVCASVHVCC